MNSYFEIVEAITNARVRNDFNKGIYSNPYFLTPSMSKAVGAILIKNNSSIIDLVFVSNTFVVKNNNKIYRVQF